MGWDNDEKAPAELRWVKRNEDKPHRCPGCHGIALRAWSSKGYGPRTTLYCPNDCTVKWTPRARGKRRRMWFKQILLGTNRGY